jgi:hypothetical protein
VCGAAYVLSIESDSKKDAALPLIGRGIKRPACHIHTQPGGIASADRSADVGRRGVDARSARLRFDIGMLARRACSRSRAQSQQRAGAAMRNQGVSLCDNQWLVAAPCLVG